MAINPNIALGVQPIQQQPNMLAQYAQIMAIKAAQQETEGYEGVRNAITGGMDAGDPRMLQYGKRGIEAFKAAGEGRVKQQDALAKAYTNSREALSMVRSPEDLLAYSVSQFSDPLIGPSLKARGLTPETVAANLQKELSTSGFETVLKKSAMGLDKFFEDQTKRRNTDVSAGASIYGSNVSRDNSIRTDTRAREQMEFDRNKRNVIAGEGQFLQTDAYGNVYPVSQFGATRGPNAPAPALPPAAANAFVTTQPSSVNALAPTASPVVQPGSPTVANALAMEQQQNIPRPKVPIRQPVAIMGPDGKSVLVPPDQAVGKQPATAFNEKTAEDKAKVNRDLETAIRNLELVVKPGGLLEKSTGSGFGRMVDASAGFFGQSTEGAVAGAQLAPIADMVLKMVPRFEGPQSNKDVDSYLAAAGKLADTGLPNDIRQGAAKTILKLMKERKGQFEIKGQEGGGGGGASGGTNSDPLGLR